MDFMSSSGKKNLQEEQLVRYMGLEGLVIILQSLQDVSGLSSSTSKNDDPETPSKNHSNADGFPIDDDLAAEAINRESKELFPQESMVNVFDRKQKMQEEIETGILKFNLSPRKGLAYLASLNHIEMTPEGVAKFLIQYQDRLDKSVVGEYLGREREYEGGFCLRVLHEYVDSMDFTNMAFDLAIRQFLNGFRLPGEAQKIDRIMEKFAERYYIQNRDTFASADMAFILAFSTIMLQTNLHNPAIREDKRMTKEQFLKQNKGISSDGEIPEPMLMDIYDRIAAEPIRITNEDKTLKKPKKDEASFTVFAVSQDKRRKDAFNSEIIEMVRTSEALFKQKSKRTSQFLRKPFKNDEMYGRPMYEVMWATFLGVFSQVLELFEDDAIINICLSGVQTAIHLACRLDIPIARDTLINALCKFTTLDTVKEMHEKNIACIITLLDVASNERDYLDESWKQILQSISQLARLQLFASGLHTDDVFFSDTASVASEQSVDRRKKFNGTFRNSDRNSMAIDPFTFFSGPSKAEATRQIEEMNAELIMREVSPDVIDQIFFNSQYLNETSVWHFVKSLCEVSMLEVNTASSMHTFRGKELSVETMTPRVFSLQKLVEVADFNMFTRPRIAWANIWQKLAEYFATIGVSDNVALSMYAIDSLKQLSIKFLQKEELSNFNFQRVFLKPFEIVISRSRFLEIKDLVLRCIDIMIRACATNIRSGWRSIFAILEVAASQDVAEISTIAFEIMERLMNNQFHLLIFDFVELMNCLVSFVSGSNTPISVRALSHLARCADHLAEGKVSPALYLQHKSTDTMGISWEKSRKSVTTLTNKDTANIEASVFRLWWPLLLGLSTRVGDSRVSIRIGALNTLSQVLRKYGGLFSDQTWSVIFKGVLFPMMDSAKTDFSQQLTSSFPSENQATLSNNSSWLGTMGEPVLSLCLEMYFIFEQNLTSLSLLSDLLVMLESCICQETEVLAKMALKALNDLLLPKTHSPPLTDEIVALLTRKLHSLMLQNVCFNFADLGCLEFSSTAPSHVKTMVRACPLNIRRQAKSMKISDSFSGRRMDNITASTSYGEGTIIEVSVFSSLFPPCLT
jgi:brefeldin A-inhibited guanine nucleotide-exchange protein